MNLIDAIRVDNVVGRGSGGYIDLECSDEELLCELSREGITGRFEAVEYARDIEQQFSEFSEDCEFSTGIGRDSR